MYIYLFINLLIIAIGVICPQQVAVRIGFDNKRKAKLPLQAVLLFIVLFVFMGFRGDFTTDYNNYSDYFGYWSESVSFHDILTRTFSMERGFVLLSKVISVFTSSSLVYHLVISFILLLLYFRVFSKKSEILWLSVLLFVNLGDYYGSMNLFRQCLAAAIVFNGFTFIEKKNTIKYYLLVILAASIHTTALIMAVAYFILRFGTSKLSGQICTIALSIAVWISIDRIIDIVTYFFPKYQNYHYGMGNGSFNAVVAPLAVYIFLLISLKLFVVDYDYHSIKNAVLLNGTLLCVICLILGTKVYMFTRLAYFFRPFVCLAVPNVLKQYADKKTMKIAIVAICIVAMAYTQISLSGTGYDPYYFYRG